MFPQLFGKYVLEREIAAGGMARVYLATLRGAVGFEKRLVVKQIRPELAVDQAFVRRFVEEAKTAVELSHPNIVPVYELGVEQGVYYIAMELCVGVTLSEMLGATGKLSPEEGAYVGVEICRALDYAHRRAGIVHRDVTPRNVLIDEEGAVRLIDFGIAAPAAGHERGPSEVFGSPGHMPPEQLAGKPLSPSADVFAVAVLMYEAWTGNAAFRRATAKESSEALKQPVVAVDEKEPALSPLADLLKRGLALDPQARPAQAELFARPLRDFLRNVDAGDVARRLGARARRTLRRSRRRETFGLQGSSAGREAFDSTSDSATSTPALGSATFAAREEVAEWTRQLDPSTAALRPSERPSAKPGALLTPSGDSGPSTRKLPSIPPSVRSTRGEGVEETRGGGVEEKGSHSVASLPAAEGPKQRSVKSSRAYIALGVLVVSLLAAFGVVRQIGRVSVDPASAASRHVALRAERKDVPWPNPMSAQVATSARSPLAHVGSESSPSLPSRTDATSGLTKEKASGASSKVVSSSAAAAASAAPGAGLLRLTADLPATVSVQGPSGVRSFSTPVRGLSLPPGAYTIVFRSSTYGSPVVTQLTLEPSSERGVHVDFREAEPRVSLR